MWSGRRFVLSPGIRVTPQGTGHGVLPLESLEGAMLLKASRMRRLDIYAAHHMARGGGRRVGEGSCSLRRGRLGALAGTAPNVGVT
jgi:hypothetical protein